MKHVFFIFLCFQYAVFSQNSIETTFINSINIDADVIVSVDNFGTIYYIKNNTFYKKSKNSITSYNNLQLGNLQSANTFNPLKISLFYPDFNTSIILDNRLAEIFKIDFNSITPYKNIAQISSGFDNTLWLFNLDNLQLELYNYKNNTTQARTLPIKSNVLHLTSNYNNAWLLTQKYIYRYNYFGNLITKLKNDGYQALAESNENIILKRDNNLFFLKENTNTITPITLPNLLIKQFFVTNETLYIYHHQTLQQFQLKFN